MSENNVALEEAGHDDFRPLEMQLIGNPCLDMICDEVKPEEFESEELLALERGMIASMFYYQTVGVAAPQVAVNRRVITQRTKDGCLMVMCNPIMFAMSDLQAKNLPEESACIPGIKVAVWRFVKIRVNYVTTSGEDHAITLEDEDAIVFQHCLDHLNGITLMDHMSEARKKREIEKLKKRGKKIVS